MKLNIKISLDNAAFGDNPDELQYLLSDIARRAAIEPYPYRVIVRDTNGNRVGYYELEA